MKKLLFIFIALLLGNMFAAFALVPSEPHNANAMWIEPSNIDLTTVSVGYKFNITTWLNLTTLGTATAIQGWQFNLTYNTQYLNISRYAVTNNNVTSELFQGLYTMGADFSVEDEKGYILIAEATATGSVKDLPCSGSLTWIEFVVTNTPPEQLTIQFNIDPLRTYIADADYNYYNPPDYFTTYPASAVIPEFSLSVLLGILLFLTLVITIFHWKSY